VSIYYARDRVVVHVAVARVDVLRGCDALLLRLVREHRSESDVTNAPDVRHACIELVVDHDPPARVDLDPNLFKTETIDIWSAADGNKDNVCLELLCKVNTTCDQWRIQKNTHCLLLSILHSFRRDSHLPVLLLSREYLGAQLKLETLLGQRFLELLPEHPVHVSDQGTNESRTE
jgi:hypothetical protein